MVQPQTLTITEGENGSYTVVLSSQPTGTVTVSAVGEREQRRSVPAESLRSPATSWNDDGDGDRGEDGTRWWRRLR